MPVASSTGKEGADHVLPKSALRFKAREQSGPAAQGARHSVKASSVPLPPGTCAGTKTSEGMTSCVVAFWLMPGSLSAKIGTGVEKPGRGLQGSLQGIF